MYYDEKDDIFRWDNDMPVKNTSGVTLPGECKTCGSTWTVELTIGVVVRCSGPEEHFFGTLMDPIRGTKDIPVGVYLGEE